MPTALIVVLSILAFLLLLFSFRIRFRLTYKERVTFALYVLCFRIPLEGSKRKKAMRGTKGKENKKAPQTKKPTLTLLQNVRLVRALTAALLRQTKKHLRLYVRELEVRVATGDAAKTAVLYGAVAASLSYLTEGVRRVSRLKIGKSVTGVVADYLGERPSAHIDLSFSLSFFRGLALLFTFFSTFVRRKRALLEKKTLPSK